MGNVALNQTAPDFEMEDFNGREVTFSDFRGESNILIVLNRGFI